MKYYPHILILLCLILGCEKFEYNIYEKEREELNERVSTAYNLKRVLDIPKKDTLNIIFTADLQRFHDDVEDLVETINSMPEVDLVYFAGDITDFGVAYEFHIIARQLSKLRAPFLTVIGNHDCLGNGKDVYQNMFGPLDYAFTWNGIRFIAHNTNSKEFRFNGKVPDLDWMQNQLADTSSYEHSLFISHVPPTSVDLDPALASDYVKILRDAKNTILSVNGHDHQYALKQTYNDGTWYLTCGSPSFRKFSYVTIYKNSGSNPVFSVKPILF